MSTIREFLVSLGYKVDEQGQSKFVQGVERATEEVTFLGKEIVATALAIQVGVSKMANDFERLYYSSQRTKSAVGSLQAVEAGARKIGLTSDQARSSVEGLMRSMRSNPGIAALLNQLGVQTRGRQGTEIFDDTVKRLSRMPFYLAQKYAGILGIEGDTLLMLINNYRQLATARDAYASQQKKAGVDPEKLAKDSVAYNNALRDLNNTLDILSQRIQSNFIGPATKVILFLDQLAKGFTEVDQATNGWAGTLATIGTTALGVYLAKLLLMKTLFRGIAVEAAGAAAATAAATGGGAAAGAAAGGVASRVWRGVTGRGGGVMGGALMAMLGMKYDSESGNRGRSWLRKQLGIKDEGEDAPWVANRKTKVVDFFMGKGWSREQAVGLMQNAQSESNINPKAVGDGGKAYGVAQWHPDRQANFRRWAGKDIRESTLEEQLGFMHHELTAGSEQIAGAMLRKTQNAGAAAAVVSKYYERPRDTVGEMNKRGGAAQRWYDANPPGASGRNGANATISQNTTINLPTSDPETAGKKVAAEQGKVNADIVRNMSAVTR